MDPNTIITIVIGIAIFLFIVFIVKRLNIEPQEKKLLITLEPEKRVSVRLIAKENITHDTRRFVFGLPSKDHLLGLPLGKHVFLSATKDGKYFSRPYTPVSLENQMGSFDLVIKVYNAGVHPKFPEGGKMSQYLESLNIGDSVDIKGPKGRLHYKSPGVLNVKNLVGPNQKDITVRKIGMIAGGTGITPMYQIIQAIINNPNDSTEMWLLFANQCEEDILMRKELEILSERHGDRFKLWYTLDRPADKWMYSKGYIDTEMLINHIPSPAKDTVVLLCGPIPMIDFCCFPSLKSVGFDIENQVFSF